MKRLKLFFACLLMAVLSIGQMWADDTGTITFGSASGSTNINAASVTGNDSQGNKWTITTAGTTSFTPNADYAQIGSSKKPATSVTFTTTLAAEQTISAFSASFGGFSGTAGTVTLKVGNTEVGTGSLNGTTDVTVNATNTTTAGTVLTVTVTDIAKGVKVTSISYTYTSGGGGGGSDPSLSVAPTSINFGTVYKDATVESQTVAVTFANLTGDVTYSGLTSPFTASGTVSATGDEITIAADASTIGEYEQTLTVTSADDDKSATVIVTMNVVAAPEPTGTFALFSGDLVEGDYVICSGTTALKNALATNTNYIGYETVTVSENEISNPSDALIWHIAASGDYWTIYNAAATNYAASTGAKNKGQVLTDISGNNADKALWTASGSSSYEFVNKANTAASVNANLRYNSGYGFACYSTSTGAALTLYKKQLPAHELTFGVASSGHGTLAASVGGSAINSGAQVAEGATVTLTPTADTYYQSAVEVLDGNADAVTTTENAGVYTFTMPASDATAEVSFVYIPVTGLTLNKTELALVEGAEDALSVTAVTPSTAFNGVTWSSNATSVATVDADGKVTAKAAGSATITATSVATGTVTATCAVTVSAPSGNPVTITQNTGGTVTASIDVADVLAGTSVTLTATPADGYSLNEWTVLDGNADEITPTATTATTFTFEMPDGEVLAEASFTHEVAVLKLHDANGESTFDGENTHYWKESVTLPETAAACSKTFVGWSAESNHSSAPELGATYVLPNKGENHIYAVYADVEGGNTDVEFNAGTYASANNWSNGTAYTGFTISGVNFKANGGGNNGKYYTSDKSWRMYNGGSIAITASANIVSVTSTPSKDFTINGTSASLSLSATTQFTSITVTVEGETTYSGYTTTCQQQAAAPTFSVEAGTYYVAQNNIVLASTTENATIYYTTDGSDPKTSGTKQIYSAAISLSERAITTIKAYAVAEGYESSAVAEATYNINLPYSFAEFAALTPKENGKEYVVRGIISQKDAFNTQYNEIPYYISANGSTEGQIKCHNGLGLNKAPFTSADDINLGDNVTVVGTWSTQYSNLNAGNWMLEYTARVPAEPAYEIVGNLTTANFDDGETFNAEILANLSVNALFTNGYKEAVDGVTFTYGEKATWAAADEKLTVTAVKNEVELVSRDFGVTVTSATLASIALKEDDENYQTKKVYYVGEEFVAPTIVATLSDETTIEAVATYKEGFDKTTVGVQNVTVSYTRGDKTETTSYGVTVKAISNDESHPHTVAEALYIIGEFFNTTTASSDSIVVEGIVSTVDKIESNSLIYYISDNGQATNELEVYKGKYLNKANFNNGNILKVGDEVVVKGKVKTYNNIKEFDSNSRLVSLAREAEVTVANVAELEVGQADLAVEDLTITTLSEGAVTLVSGDEAIATIVDNKIHAVAAGVVTITANVAANGIYKAASAEFTVTVIDAKPRYAVTFSTGEAGENVSGNAPEAIDNQLENAEVTLPACTWTWEGHKFTGWAVTYGENVPVEVENNQFNMPAGNVTLTAQWAEVATCRISFMVGGEEKASIDKEQEVAFTIAQDGSAWAPTGFTFVGWATEEQAEETEVAPTTITEYTPQAGISAVSLYGIYSRVEGEGETNHYVLDYEAEDLANNSSWGAYGTAYEHIAVDGGVWTIKAFKSSGMQINTTKSAYIKVPVCPANIKQIELTCNASAKKAVKFCATASDNAEALANGSEATAQTLDLSGKSVTIGYIIPTGNCQITHIDVAYDAAKAYYTSSPVEKVTITFDANGGEGGCQKAIINKGSELTICAEAPTKTHSEFAGWKNGDDVYEAGHAYTFNADITLTAQWNEAAKYTVTYAKGGDDVTGAAPTDENEYYAGDPVTLVAHGALAKDGYTFQGWKYGSKLYKAGASFTMPAEAVEFVAQWRKASVPVDKMSMVTSASALSNGMQIALGCSYVKDEVSYFVMAGDIASGKSFLSSKSENITLSDGVATYTDAVVVMTLEQVENGWKITKDGTNYLKETSAKNLAWVTENATVWTISFNGNNVLIEGDYATMKYNSASGQERFTTYSSDQKDIQLFGKAVVVTENASISDLGYTDGEAIVASGANVTLTIDEPTTVPSITAKDGATVVIEEQTTAKNVVVEDGSKIVANAETTTPTVYFATTMGSTQTPGTASELGSVTNITLATGGEIIYDLTLGVDMSTPEGAEKAANQWHAFTLPFPVDAINGIYNAANDQKLTNEVDYAIMDYHGDIRANGDYGWKKYRGILQPGVFYLMTVNGDIQTFRFKAAKTGAMTQTTSMGYKAYNGSGDPSKDFGWNGIGNPAWVSGTVAVNVQVLDPYSYTYQPLTINTNITVSTPFFYNAGGDGSTGSVVMQDAGAGVNYAPARTPANEIKNVAVSFGNEVFRDKIYISASEDALNEYEQDKDLVRMIMSNTPKVAQIFGNAYGMKLSMVNAPMVNDQATYGLTLYAPNAGAYTIVVPELENADIYLTYEGSIIWNLSMGEYTSDFAKGNNEGYGLLLIKKITGISTGVENIEAAEAGVQKVVIDDKVFILRGEKMYDVTGKMVK